MCRSEQESKLKKVNGGNPEETIIGFGWEIASVKRSEDGNVKTNRTRMTTTVR